MHVERGEIFARMPTEPERREYGMKEGIPVLVVEREGQEEEMYPADRVKVRVGMQGTGASTTAAHALTSRVRQAGGLERRWLWRSNRLGCPARYEEPRCRRRGGDWRVRLRCRMGWRGEEDREYFLG
jgi:hypothetical protein